MHLNNQFAAADLLHVFVYLLFKISVNQNTKKKRMYSDGLLWPKSNLVFSISAVTFALVHCFSIFWVLYLMLKTLCVILFLFSMSIFFFTITVNLHLINMICCKTINLLGCLNWYMKSSIEVESNILTYT